MKEEVGFVDFHVHISSLTFQVDDLFKERLIPTVKLDGFDIFKYFVLKFAELLLDLVIFVVLIGEAVMNFPIPFDEGHEKYDSHNEGTTKDHIESVKTVYKFDRRSDQIRAFPGEASESPRCTIDAVDGSVRKILGRCLSQLELFLENHRLNDLLS